MSKIFLTILFLNAFWASIDAHTYSLGDCPHVDPASDFQMKKMLGIWYVIQKTSTASSCIMYNFTKTDEPDEYLLEQTSQHFVLELTPVEHEYHYTGTLMVPDSSVPARMKVKFPLNVAGTASYTVFMTDYEHYAGIFTCQKLTFAHRQSATILSRERSLDKVYVDKIRSRLTSYNIDPFDLSIITQKDCPKNKDADKIVNISIDNETFSAQSIKNVVKKAGEKIGDGIKFVADGAKKIYEKVTSSEEDDNKKEVVTERVTEKAKFITPNPDSEWFP